MRSCALDSEAIMLVGPLVRIDAYRDRLTDVLRNSLRKPIDITISSRRGIEAACMLAVSDIALMTPTLNVCWRSAKTRLRLHSNHGVSGIGSKS